MSVTGALALILPLLSVAAEDCNPYAKCLTCPAEAPFTCTSCEKGYFLARGGAYYHCRQCPDACAECDDIITCTLCETGRYGIECQDVCSKGCINASCDIYLGHCDCKENYTGPKCDKCIDGKYGYELNCDQNCPFNCKTCISRTNCTQCKDGNYGLECEYNCSKGCYSDACIQSNGICYGNKCKPNFEGLTCNKCSTRRYGKDCASACPENCLSCKSETNCDICEQGHWGPRCENNCSVGCVQSLCWKETGTCKHSKCKAGFSGDQCNNCIIGKHGTKCSISDTFDSSSSAALHFKVGLLMTVLPFSVGRYTGAV